MTPLPQTSTASRRLLRPGAMALLATTALGLVACNPPEEPPQLRREVKACDASLCLVAWQVVDSDDDGVADADELVTGTDPYDRTSRPDVAELAKVVAVRGPPPSSSAGRPSRWCRPRSRVSRRPWSRPIAPVAGSGALGDASSACSTVSRR